MGDIELLSGLKKALLKTVKIPSEEAGKNSRKKSHQHETLSFTVTTYSALRCIFLKVAMEFKSNGSARACEYAML